VASDNQSITMNTNEILVHRGSLACRQGSPCCGDSLTWRFTRLTRNRVPHNQHKMRITQATSNPLEYLLALHRGKVKNPLTITMIGAGDKHLPSLDDPRCTKLSRWWQPQEKQVKSTVKHNHQVPLDAITQVMHLDSLLISQR
jgi:hypothetical protein